MSRSPVYAITTSDAAIVNARSKPRSGAGNQGTYAHRTTERANAQAKKNRQGKSPQGHEAHRRTEEKEERPSTRPRSNTKHAIPNAIAVVPKRDDSETTRSTGRCSATPSERTSAEDGFTHNASTTCETNSAPRRIHRRTNRQSPTRSASKHLPRLCLFAHRFQYLIPMTPCHRCNIDAAGPRSPRAPEPTARSPARSSPATRSPVLAARPTHAGPGFATRR